MDSFPSSSINSTASRYIALASCTHTHTLIGSSTLIHPKQHDPMQILQTLNPVCLLPSTPQLILIKIHYSGFLHAQPLTRDPSSCTLRILIACKPFYVFLSLLTMCTSLTSCKQAIKPLSDHVGSFKQISYEFTMSLWAKPLLSLPFTQSYAPDPTASELP